MSKRNTDRGGEYVWLNTNDARALRALRPDLFESSDDEDGFATSHFLFGHPGRALDLCDPAARKAVGDGLHATAAAGGLGDNDAARRALIDDAQRELSRKSPITTPYLRAAYAALLSIYSMAHEHGWAADARSRAERERDDKRADAAVRGLLREALDEVATE